MKVINIHPNIGKKCPDLKIACLECNVQVQTSQQGLLDLIANKTKELESSLSTEGIHQIESVAFTRQAYKDLGKEPSRYRPSAEALLRRVIKGKGLYQINNVVDLLNLVSILTGYSIGGYDADKIEGEINMGVGEEGEPYQAIGRGKLNIACLPVLRDDLGVFGSPTSDSERTMVRPETKRFLMTIFHFNGTDEALNSVLLISKKYLSEFGVANVIEEMIYK